MPISAQSARNLSTLQISFAWATSVISWPAIWLKSLRAAASLVEISLVWAKTKIAEAVYKNNGIITIKKDFSSLNSVKDRLRECILKNMLESCFTNKKQENNIITFAFSNINETIFLDNKVETLSFNFKIDKDDTGLNTSF